MIQFIYINGCVRLKKTTRCSENMTHLSRSEMQKRKTTTTAKANRVWKWESTTQPSKLFPFDSATERNQCFVCVCVRMSGFFLETVTKSKLHTAWLLGIRAHTISYVLNNDFIDRKSTDYSLWSMNWLQKLSWVNYCWVAFLGGWKLIQYLYGYVRFLRLLPLL